MGDEYSVKKSNMSGYEPEQFKSKQLLYVQDINGGTYNGQVQIDTMSLSNSGKYLDWSEGTLEIPIILTMKSSVDITAAGYNGFMMGLKNGHHQLIDSIEVNYNNKSVVQVTPFTNLYVSYKLMTSLSEDDVKKHGNDIGFIPDSAGSYYYSAGAGVNGNGHCNNTVNESQTLTYASELEVCNKGFLQRMRETAYPISATQTGYNGLTAMNTAASCAAVGKSYFTDDAGAAAARIYQWNMIACIRLKDLSDFFEKLPLVKGANMRITLNMNTCSQVVTAVTGTSLVQAAPTMLSGRTNPLLVASVGVAEPGVTAFVTGTLTIACGVARALNSTISPMINSCRLYVPAYEFTEDAEIAYLSANPRKEIVYNDIYNYNVTSVAAGGSVNNLLTNGLADLQSIVVIPIYNSAALNNATIALNPIQSCFDTAPATTSPLASLTQFNINVSGKNIFQNNIQYDFDAFQNELARVNAINGGSFDGLTSGLVGRYEFDNAYRYYVADLSRGSPSEAKIPKSVTLLCQNNSTKILDLYCFIVHRKRIVIEMTSGARID